MATVLIKFIFCWCLCFYWTECLPKIEPNNNALKFMKNYGYLIDDNEQSEAIYSQENLSEIIKKVQHFGAIEETGVIDNNTLKLMTSRRCGVPDIRPEKFTSNRRKRFAIVSGWNKRHLTYYISNWSLKLGEATVAENIEKALNVWGRYGRLSFSRVDSPKADIIVTFGRGYHGDRYPFDGPGLILAHAFFPSNGDEDLSGDIHFDDDEDWSVSSNDGTDFFTVALHELGHSLGLSHSTVSDSVMFPYYKESQKDSNNLLDYDDILGMYTLYIQRTLNEDQFETSTKQQFTTANSVGTRPWRTRPWFGPRKPTSTETPTSKATTPFSRDDGSIDDDQVQDPRGKTLPNICNGHFDAVATLRGELFIFKNQYIWRLKDKGFIYPGYPTLIRQMFPKLPENITKIDAAYQRPDGNIVFFTGTLVWIFNGFEFIEDSPLSLTHYELPEYLDSVDAVQTWAKNGKTYIYKRDRFWRYNEKTKTMDAGYPMSMERWKGVPNDLDAAISWKDGVTYFFKGDLFWKFDNNWITTTEESPLPVSPIWLGCQEVEKMKRLSGP
ncbi:hypothetical protein ABEB36_011564 [Hypothenemus hampei]|uniref:Peptidase metallopeptidase domain-containing protein n=1 Tax=Hypothenemus hampei TaxID=57062 RepID=A0ABD1E914_HYPHA